MEANRERAHLASGAPASCRVSLKHVSPRRARQYRLQAVQFLHLTTPNMRITGLGKVLSAWLLLAVSLTTANAQRSRASNPGPGIPVNTLLRVLRAEDERRWDNNLAVLLAHKDTTVRKRAALAIGRIGDERAV